MSQSHMPRQQSSISSSFIHYVLSSFINYVPIYNVAALEEGFTCRLFLHQFAHSEFAKDHLLLLLCFCFSLCLTEMYFAHKFYGRLLKCYFTQMKAMCAVDEKPKESKHQKCSETCQPSANRNNWNYEFLLPEGQDILSVIKNNR